ncbi:hypothetical protein [Streptomyces sp. NPDC050504]|uniref:hypothetical protein n=1 Tax=Streptomyces sp. NPDC050504 TaxID=3365618 RepID=UPI00379A6D3B
MAEPLHRTILLFDIEKFGARDDVEQAFLQRMLHDIADATLAAAGVGASARLRADRGDAVVELIDAHVPVSVLVKSLLTETPMLLHDKNRLMAASARMRLRIVLAAGYVAVQGDRWVGTDLNHAFRLLDAEPLREALKATEDGSVLCVSDGVYQGVVRHGHHGVRPELFQRLTTETKEGQATAWLYRVAPPPASSPSPGTPAAGAAADAPPGGAAQTGGVQIGGDQYGVAGGEVRGDLNFDFRGGGR